MFTDYSKILSRDLHVPSLEDAQKALSKGLKNVFAEVSVDIVDCPDLSAEPFNLACKGLGGTTSVVEVGGPPYLLPKVDRQKVYDVKDIVKAIGLQQCFVIGAGAGPWPFIGKNAEMVANVYIDGNNVKSLTHIAKLKDDGTNNIEVSVLPNTETRFALLANLFFSEGVQSKVLKVHCKKRTGSDNFVTAMRNALHDDFPDKVVGVGGAFLLKSGKALQHVMPDFSKSPLNSDEELNKWLEFYSMSAPLVAVGTLVSSDIPELDLRVQHFHSFSSHGEAGHYHQDTTPNEVEYLGYFNLGQKIYRIDKPPLTHSWGRD
uniref:DUF1907 domain-containing protein n=1 Tax=Riptortus pedestris TaxID=329032 RepID=R4WD98_RIPPE|nr:conserved hypothetical protein [Riptortus pedestris]